MSSPLRKRVIQAAGIGVQPRSAKGWSQAGWEEFTAGDIAGARTDLEKAVAIYPDDIDAHANLAPTLAASGDLEAAIVEGERAVALAPAYPRAKEVLRSGLLALAARREQQGDFAAAQRLRAEAAR
jgi:tetratricopeptide (TPR) repeat protein